MKFHIVSNGESINSIIKIYSLSIDEIKEVNKHIRDWYRLIPGTKLRIPIITESIDQDILEMEPFIEDYYPKNIDIKNEVYQENINLNENKEEDIIKDNLSEEMIENNNLENENSIPSEAINSTTNNDIRPNKKEGNPPYNNHYYQYPYYYYPNYYYYQYPYLHYWYYNGYWCKPKKRCGQ